MSPARSKTRHGLAWLGTIFLSLLPPTPPSRKGKRTRPSYTRAPGGRSSAIHTYPGVPTCRVCERHTGSGGLRRESRYRQHYRRHGGPPQRPHGAVRLSCAAPFLSRVGAALHPPGSIPRVLGGSRGCVWRSAWGGGGHRCRRRDGGRRSIVSSIGEAVFGGGFNRTWTRLVRWMHCVSRAAEVRHD